MSVFAFLDLAVFTLPTGQYYLLDNWSIHSASDATTIMPAWATGALSILIAVSALGLIFLYKRRMLQMRLTILTLLVIIGQLC